MSVIDSPDNKGIACSWCPKCMRFPDTLGGATNPPCQPNYNLGKVLVQLLAWLWRYQHEVRSLLVSHLRSDYSGCNPVYKLFSHSGQLLSNKRKRIDLSRFAKGFITCEGQVGRWWWSMQSNLVYQVQIGIKR